MNTAMAMVAIKMASEEFNGILQARRFFNAIESAALTSGVNGPRNLNNKPVKALHDDGMGYKVDFTVTEHEAEFWRGFAAGVRAEL